MVPLLLSLTSALAAPLTPRAPLVVDPVELLPLPVDAPMAGYRLSIKLNDELRGRATPDGGLISANGADLSEILAVAAQHGIRFEPLIRLPGQRLAALESRAAARSGREQPDLRGMLAVIPRDRSPEGLLAAGMALEQLAGVEYANLRVIGLPPPGDIGTTTPDYTGYQTYIGPDPGIDIEYAWSVGATGANVKLSDCEYGWVDTHEDLVDRALNLEPGQTVPSWVTSYEYDEHGTSTVGQTSAVENDYGCTGMVPDAEVYTFPEWSDEEGARRVTSITSAVDGSAAGDVVMLEMQDIGAGGGYAPAEVDPDVWAIVRVASDAGVHVVGAAGNGTQNLDSRAYTSYMDWGDSGGIIVGAGTGDVNHDAAWFSTYGTRVDLQGWGDYTVFSLGYGDYAAFDRDRNQRYTAAFAGTSSATPIVTSAVVAISDFVQAGGGEPLSPEGMRQLLIDTGVPQGSGGEIGPLPNLMAAFAELDTDGDGYTDLSYGGTDCDDDDPSTSPGAAEVWYDGIDTNCDGLSDYDQDADAHDLLGEGEGDDCDDADPASYPGAPESWYDGVDQNCDGLSDYDQDGDGHDADGEGEGDDCDDTNPDVYPGASGEDNDCTDPDPPVGDDTADTDAPDDSGGAEGEGEGEGEGEIEDLEPKPAGCACASVEDSPSAGAALGLALLGLSLSRRRQNRRS